MSNMCVCCGRDIPEGRQVCPICENSHVAADAYLADGTPLFLKTQIKNPPSTLQLFLYELLHKRGRKDV